MSIVFICESVSSSLQPVSQNIYITAVFIKENLVLLARKWSTTAHLHPVVIIVRLLIRMERCTSIMRTRKRALEQCQLIRAGGAVLY